MRVRIGLMRWEDVPPPSETMTTEVLRPAIAYLKANPRPEAVDDEPVMAARQYFAFIHRAGLDELMDFERTMKREFSDLFWPLFWEHTKDAPLNEQMPCGCIPESRPPTKAS